jgi:hypothetical protein
MSFCFLRNKQCKSSFLCNSFAFIRMKYIFFTDLRSSKKCQNYKKSFLREQRKFCRRYKKSFLRERSVSFLLKSRSKGNAEPNTAKIEGEEVQKTFLRERSVSFLLKSRSKGNAEPNTAKIEGEEVQKTFLRGCRTYTAEIEGEEVQKTFLRGCRTYTKK